MKAPRKEKELSV